VATCQTEVSADGFEIIRLHNSAMSISVLPQLGGKIHEIVDLNTGRDWLWKNSHITLQHPQPGMDYEKELDSGGWDEVLFSVKPCKIDLADDEHLMIGDHGCAVERAWQVVKTGLNDSGDAICELLTEGKSPHFRLHRKITMDADEPQLRIEYSLKNTGTKTWPWLWCAHPLFAVENNMFIKFQGDQRMRHEVTDPDQQHKEMDWPMLIMANGTAVDMARIYEESPSPETLCTKLFVSSEKEISLCVSDRSESLSILYDPHSIPWLGLWVNKNAWSGCGSEPYLNLGLEPTTSPHDNLADAIAQDEADYLAVGETRTWTLMIRLNTWSKS
jgi:galactose mutarotase-like enzyme